MDHLTLSLQFNKLAYELSQKHNLIDDEITPLQDEILLRRIVFSRYYYALYHKYMAHDSDLNTKSGPGIHGTILTKIQNCNDYKLLQVYKKLMNLRIWADYKLDITGMETQVNLNMIATDVWSIIKRQSLNC